MALWFVSYATSPITATIYDVSIVIVYDVTLLLSMTYHFQSRLGKTDCTDIWVIGRASLVFILRDVTRFTPLLARLVQ